MLLLTLLALPLLVASMALAVRGVRRFSLVMLLFTLGASLVMSTALLIGAAAGQVTVVRVGDWPQGIAINLVIDAASALMLVLTDVVTLAAVAFGARVGATREPFFAPLVLVLVTGVSGALMTADLFNLFVFIEVMLLPSYGLLVLAHRGTGMRMQVTGTRIYVVINLLASSVFLMGVALIYSSLGQVGFGPLVGRGATNATSLAGCALVLFALCVKAGVVPMHTWIGRTYPHMSPTTSALFSGLHTKVAVYAIFRIHGVLFGGGDQWTQLGTWVFCVSMVIGVFAAIGEKDSRAILSLHMVSQIGYVLLGFAVHTQAAIAAALFYLVNNVLAKSSLFLSMGAIETAYGRHPLGVVKGLLRRERVTAVVFFAAAMALAGLPPTSGFLAKLTLIVASFSAQQWLAGGVAVGVSLFTLMSMLKIWDYAFLRGNADEQCERGSRIVGGLIGPAAGLATLCLVLGVWGHPLLVVCDVAAQQLLHPSPQHFGGR